MCKSFGFGAVLAITLASTCAAGGGDGWRVVWFDAVANKAAKYEAGDRADVELFIRSHLQGVNLATGGPACTKIQLLMIKDGAAQQVDAFTVDVKTAVDLDKPADPEQAAGKAKAMEKEGWLKALAQSDRKLGEALQEFERRLKNEAKEVGDARKSLGEDGAEAGEMELKQIDDAIANYNRIAAEGRAGPLSAFLSDLQSMKPVSGSAKKVSVRLVRERLLTVQAKLEEIGLRLEQRELAESREQLRAEVERIGRDKEAGLDVRRRQQQVEAAVVAWKSRRDDLQRRIESHSATVDEVFAARQALDDIAEKTSQAPPDGPK